MSPFKRRDSFTLIELLVVLAIVAILSVVVILTLNPAELIKQSRDSTRLSDLSTLNTALGIYNTDVAGGFMGTSSIVYVSIPDTSPTCTNLGLPTLPGGWTYNCVTSTSTRLTNGLGWIPVNLSSISFGSPLSSLPLDPVNTTSSGNYYTYVPGGSFQLSSRFESDKYKPQAATTNSYDPGLYVLGSDTNLAPFIGGLVGWWKMDGDFNDSSGYNATSSINGSFSFLSGKTGHAAAFDGSTNYLDLDNISTGYNVDRNSNITVSAWINPNSVSGSSDILSVGGFSYCWNYGLVISNPGHFAARFNDGDLLTTSNYILTSQWNFVTIVLSSPAWQVSYYYNGSLVEQKTTNWNRAACAHGARIGSAYAMGGFYPEKFDGSIDDLRVYNRALSAAEILALYNSTK